jgi:hypothetical protein
MLPSLRNTILQLISSAAEAKSSSSKKEKGKQVEMKSTARRNKTQDKKKPLKREKDHFSLGSPNSICNNY